MSGVHRKLAAAGVLGVAGALLLPGIAAAHVSVTPNTVQDGQSARVTFRVPNERDDASTVRVELVLPADHPITGVSVGQVPGWTVTVQKQKLATPVSTSDGSVTEAVSSVVWQGGSIPPDQFAEFPVSLGKLPPGQLVVKALQTYSDGQVVRWIDGPEAGADAAHPAPTVTVATPAPAAAPKSESSADWPARVLGGAGILTALVTLALRRRSTPGA
ncbi:YcnI family protein [Amycolatopsis cynarae]|uniref:YcnI family protein n=1 Tax=Amycolatopsis cynarae TaxID=2995223 RepID=A0ABY7AZH1_9PSEU|nr:YcnI family protein [Amycolatopsis sp. HUAS 11-8]WAL65434.1 YcnI family protein [Amycolatopsis sp. HUAS 11-8]